MNERLKKQMEFIAEADKLKQVYRQSLISDGSRHENDAEHSWHTALMCLLLAEYAPKGTNVLKSAELMLIHDLVEIYAGDTYFYDEEANASREEREKAAAEKLYSLLPADQCELYKSMWEEFEEKKTDEAKFAAAMDRIQPLMLNYMTKGERWKHHNVTKDIVKNKMAKALANAHPELYALAENIIEDGAKKGYFPEK